jgi:beta-glucanase (GH16 family)
MQFRAITRMSVILLASAVGSRASGPTPPPQAAGYSLVFFDDFMNLDLSANGTTEATWYKGFFWETTPVTPFNASVSSSVLDLAWTSGQSRPDTTMSSCSPDGTHCRTFRYGYFEARMKWDVSQGAWPSFLMLPVQAMWGASENGELDVFEGQAEAYNMHTYFGTIHDEVTTNGTTVDVQNNNCCNYHAMPTVDFSQWHTYGVLWVPGEVTWYLDNSPVLKAATYPIFDKQNYYLVFNSELGANWSLGSTTGVTATRLNLYVDWVKAWQSL